MTRFLKNSWVVGIGTGLFVLLSGYFLFGIGKTSSSDTYNISSEDQSGGITAAKVEIDAPAQFSASTTLTQQDDGKYVAIIKISADKETNHPSQLCIILKSDVVARPASKAAIMNDGAGMAEINVGDNFGCIQNPLSHITAWYVLDSKPTFFNVEFQAM